MQISIIGIIDIIGPVEVSFKLKGPAGGVPEFQPSRVSFHKPDELRVGIGIFAEIGFHLDIILSGWNTERNSPNDFSSPFSIPA